MIKIFALVVVLSIAQQSEALKCHFCLDACEVSKSTEKVCGTTISDSQEAICTTEQPKDTKTPGVAVRRCQIASKGVEPPCPPNSVCTTCKKDLCNAASLLNANVALLSLVASIAFYLVH